MDPFTIAMLIIGAVSAIAGTTVSAVNNANNISAQKKANAENVAMQERINQANIDYSKEFAQNQIQWKMDDLQSAGLNPVLAAQGAFGGSSSPATMQAAQVQPVRSDLSGVTNALQSMNNMMMTLAVMDQRRSIANNHDATAVANTNSRNAVSRANNESRNDVLNNLYKRKAQSFAEGSKAVHSAKQVQSARQKLDNDGTWEKIKKELDMMPYKYKWKK